ncbi:MAG: hypothetical protein MK110_07865 [Fuerstiella sp.]|nr:hypothetical protein [Fuerstiella sp.]
MVTRRNEKTISLFPFLAVLVCTMGALILLLLVTTRRIRQKQQATPVETVLSDSAVVEPVSQPAGGVDSGATVAESVLASVELAVARQQSLENELSLKVYKRDHSALFQQVSRHTREVAELKCVLEAECENSNTASSDNNTLTRELTDLQNERVKLEDELKTFRESVRQSEVKRSAAESMVVTANQLIEERHSALQDLSEIRQDQLADPGTTVTIIEFSNSAGTARTPIVVDVTGSEFVFPATQIKIRRSDMEGVLPTDNPLLSGVLAVHRKRCSVSSGSRPYVLLLVRPAGTLDFYLAQRIFTESGIHFGYELLEENAAIAAAQPVEGEADVLETAVRHSLQRRDQQARIAFSLRQRIAAARGARRDNRDRSYFGSNETTASGRRRYFSEPFDDTELDESSQNPLKRYAERTQPEQDSSDRHRSFGSSKFPHGGADESGDPAARFSNPEEVRKEVWRSIPSVAEAQNHVEGALAQALAERRRRQDRNRGSSAGTKFSSSDLLKPQRTREKGSPDVRGSGDGDLSDEFVNTSTFAESDVEEFRAEQQPLTPRPVPQNSSPRHAGGNSVPGGTQPGRPSQEGHNHRPNETSVDALNPPDSTMARTSALSPKGGSAGGSPSRTITGGLITYKQVTIYLDPQHFTIAGQPSVALHGRTVSHITQELADRLFEISLQNPHPLVEMTAPSAKFVVSPGAHTLYLQLATGLHRLRIPVASMVSMEAFVRSDDRVFEPVTKPAVQQPTSQFSDVGDLP